MASRRHHVRDAGGSTLRRTRGRSGAHRPAGCCHRTGADRDHAREAPDRHDDTGCDSREPGARANANADSDADAHSDSNTNRASNRAAIRIPERAAVVERDGDAKRDAPGDDAGHHTVGHR